MAKFSIKTYNAISPLGLAEFDNKVYKISDKEKAPDAIVLRSFKLHDEPIAESVLAVGRAGAGVRNVQQVESELFEKLRGAQVRGGADPRRGIRELARIRLGSCDELGDRLVGLTAADGHHQR